MNKEEFKKELEKRNARLREDMEQRINRERAEAPKFIFAENNPIAVNFQQERRDMPGKKLYDGGNDQVIDTLGIELESLHLSQDNVLELLENLPEQLRGLFKVTRDASSEIKVYPYNVGKRQFWWSSHTPQARQLFQGNRNAKVIGYEAVSKPIEMQALEPLLYLLMPKLQMAGDLTNERCAFHVHVGMCKNLEIAQKALALGLYADELFFRLAGMGDTFRGESNNSIYCRPLQSGPYIFDGGNYYQVLNWEKALSAKNFTDFWYPYHINYRTEFSKYVAGRYFAINILSILIHGTLEFRHFNQSFDPVLMTAIAKLCQMFAEIVVKGKESNIRCLQVGDVFTNQSPSYYHNKLNKLLALGHDSDCKSIPDEKSIRSLAQIIDNAKPLQLKDVPVKTHLRDYPAQFALVQAGELKKSRMQPIHPDNIDIHNIQDQILMRGK